MLIKYKDTYPKLGNNCFIAEGAKIIGDVVCGDDCSFWFNSVTRGDVHYIKIGSKTNVQDNSVLHVTHDTHPLIIGKEVTIGHSVTLHGCTVEDRCLIGMGSIILDGAVIGEGSIIGAGTLIKEGQIIPPRSLVVGLPGRVVKQITDEQYERLIESADNYIKYSDNYRDTKT